ncbi:MAG TPA: hypothetical protein VIF09_18705 [Polyangiaceae bacterium]|jgi:hypothetical protein
MADRIRPRVWLLGLAPIVLVVAGVVWLVAEARSKPPAQPLPALVVEPAPAQPPESGLAASPSPPPSVLAAAPLPAPSPADPAPAPSASPDEPEPIPELEEIRTPPGSQGWSKDRKLAYMQKVLDDLDGREHQLERQEADAKRARDWSTERRKAATLAYLRTQKASYERMHDVALGVRGDHD